MELTKRHIINNKENYWTPLPEELWEQTINNLDKLTPTSTNLGTHCCDSTYDLPGIQWNVTWEYSHSKPISIEFNSTD